MTIAVGLQDRPAAAPTDSVFVSDFKIINNPTFTKAISAISSIVFSYAGTGAFFPIAAEMRDPRYYTRALLLCQGVVTSVYVAVGVIVYYFCGSYVSSPALGSAGPLVKKVAYGLGLAGLLVSSTLVTHVRKISSSPWMSYSHFHSWLASMFSSASSVDRGISLLTLLFIGSPGLGLPLVSLS